LQPNPSPSPSPYLHPNLHPTLHPTLHPNLHPSPNPVILIFTLLLTPGVYKTKLCIAFENGHCQNGTSCNFAHGDHELQALDPAVMRALADGTYFDSPHDPTSSKRGREDSGLETGPEPPGKSARGASGLHVSAVTGIVEIPTRATEPENKNRVQKRPRGEEKPATICKYYLKSSCNKGAACEFRHEGTVGIIEDTICKFLMGGSCSKGSNCSFSHDLKLVPCKFMVCTGRCGDGDACRFSHLPPDPQVT